MRFRLGVQSKDVCLHIATSPLLLVLFRVLPASFSTDKHSQISIAHHDSLHQFSREVCPNKRNEPGELKSLASCLVAVSSIDFCLFRRKRPESLSFIVSRVSAARWRFPETSQAHAIHTALKVWNESGKILTRATQCWVIVRALMLPSLRLCTSFSFSFIFSSSLAGVALSFTLYRANSCSCKVWLLLRIRGTGLLTPVKKSHRI